MNRISAALVAVAALALAGCGVEAPAEQPAAPKSEAKQSPLEGSFERAAHDYQVPVALLKSIAYVETRVRQQSEPSAMGGYGVMQLVERADWNTLQRAAELTGVDAARLKIDPDANIRGAAAVLRDLADQSFQNYADLNPTDPADFFHAISLYAGMTEAKLAQDYAEQVFVTAESGFTVETPNGIVSQQPYSTTFRRHLPQITSRQDALKEYPGAYTWAASPNYTSGHGAYTYVLIHTTQGSYAGTVSWFKNTASQVSAHYVVRSSDGQITQMVEHANTAWHAQCYNSKSIGIEHEGYVNDPATWYTDAMYGESAKLTRWIADRHGIPKDRSHIIGHYEVAPSCNTGGHTDPGSGWNWSKYMGLVVGSTPTTTTGKLTGAIYQAGDSNNRVSGAVVTVNGQSVTTGADGLYAFTLQPGTYTATVTKSGYGSNSVSRTVTAGATIWGSMEINAQTAAGTVKGKIYEYNAGNPSDTSVALSGAVVTCNGQSQTTAADGMYSFSLPPGTYTVNVSKAGYQSNSVSRQVTSGGTIWGSMGLQSTSAADTQAPQVAISFPARDSSMDIAVVTLTGTASDNAGAISEVKLSINGGTEATVAVSNGAFSQQIKLAPGANTIAVKATDAAGNVGTDTSTATFNAGISGFVFQGGDESARIPDATITLVNPADGSTAATAQSSADGSFALNVSKVGMDYKLVVRANGFLTDAETVTVPDDARLSMKFPLTPGQDPQPTDVGIEFTQPTDNSIVTSEQLTIYGNVKGVQATTVNVNGAPADLFDGGGFTATVALQMGDNEISVVARGIHDEEITGILHVKRVEPGTIPQGDGKNEAVGKTGCAAVPGDLAFALLLLAPALRRIRRK
ncbi:MAG: N-acetylmuramoyl-L-alanine amidase [Myxococcaceae bacterium]